MTESTTTKIKSFSTDPRQGNALEALMDWCGVTSLMHIPESAALEFLDLLEKGEVTINNVDLL